MGCVLALTSKYVVLLGLLAKIPGMNEEVMLIGT